MSDITIDKINKRLEYNRKARESYNIRKTEGREKKLLNNKKAEDKLKPGRKKIITNIEVIKKPVGRPRKNINITDEQYKELKLLKKVPGRPLKINYTEEELSKFK